MRLSLPILPATSAWGFSTDRLNMFLKSLDLSGGQISPVGKANDGLNRSGTSYHLFLFSFFGADYVAKSVLGVPVGVRPLSQFFERAEAVICL